MNVKRPNISLRTFLKTKVKYLKSGKRKLSKLHEFPEINDVQILTVLCINYWSVNVAFRSRQQKCFGLYLIKQGRLHRLIHVMDLFIVV